MRTRNIFTKLSIAVALVAIVATGSVWEIRRVHASPPPDPDRQLPPDPCRATMEVFDNASGRSSIFAGFQPPRDPDRR